MPVQGFPQTGQLLTGQLAGGRDFLFIRLERRGQVTLPQFARGVFDQFAQVKLLGSLVRLVKILGHAFKACAVTHGLPAGGFVGRAAKELRVHETFHQQDRMPVRRQPILRKPRQIERQRAAGQIGKLARGAEQTEAGIVGEQRQARTPLVVAPTDPLIARVDVISRRRPAQQRQPLVLNFDHVA